MNIPDCFKNSKNILFAGIGGGFDIFGALPLWSSLLFSGSRYNFVFSSYNPKATGFTNTSHVYPELELQKLIPNVLCYSLPKVGVKAYQTMYAEIIKTHEIDTVVAIDGGVDSLMHGDEADPGTILEDFANIIAINEVHKNSLLVCSGFGTELEEGVCHYRVLENMAQLIKQDAFLGSCSLVKNTPEYALYKEICEKVWANGRKSHIQSKIISATMGLFGATNYYDGVEANVAGNHETINFISPLMSIYWFFKLPQVIENNVLYKKLLNTNTKTDLLMMYRQSIDEINARTSKSIPY